MDTGPSLLELVDDVRMLKVKVGSKQCKASEEA
jgi:hypothetical protein